MSDLILAKSLTSVMSATRGLRDRQLPHTSLEFDPTVLSSLTLCPAQ
jgi:hypothetical protein